MFNLMGQCFQDIGLTEWMNIIAKQCPPNTDRTKANFDECIRDYLEALAGFTNVGDQLICWLRTAKKPALMPMHEFMRHHVQLVSYLDGGYLCRMMEIPTAQEKSEQILFMQPKVHWFKFAETNKMVPMNPLKLITFFEQCQVANEAAGVLEKAKDKKQPKEKKTAHLPVLRSHESSYQQHHPHKYTTIIKATNMIAMTNNPTIVIKMIDATIALVVTIRTLRTASPIRRRMIAHVITSRKKATRPCTMTSPLC
jgi:hypothetical protein